MPPDVILPFAKALVLSLIISTLTSAATAVIPVAAIDTAAGIKFRVAAVLALIPILEPAFSIESFEISLNTSFSK